MSQTFRLYEITARKLTNTASKTWHATYIGAIGGFHLLHGYFTRQVVHRYLGTIEIGAPSLEFFSKNDCFSIFQLYHQDYSTRYFYCNFNSRPMIEAERIEIFDYELDLLVDGQFNCLFLDVEDLQTTIAAQAMSDSEKNDLTHSLKVLLKLISTRQFPFANHSIADILPTDARMYENLS